MGLAILLVLLYHASITFPCYLITAPFSFLHKTLYFAVDIFIFLSGYGLVRSRFNTRKPWPLFFYQRLTRILPAFYVGLTGLFLIQILKGYPPKIKNLFLRYSTLSFWFGKPYFFASEWFIPALLGLYLLFPLLFIKYERSLDKLRFVVFSIALSLLVDAVLIIIHCNHLLIMTTRIPALILGIHVGYSTFSDMTTGTSNIGKRSAIITVIACYTVLSILFKLSSVDQRFQYGLWWLPLIPAIIPVSVLMAQWIAKLREAQNRQLAKKILWLLRFSGVYSLEIFVLHQFFYDVFPVISYLCAYCNWVNEVMHYINRGGYFEFTLYATATLVTAPILGKADAWIKGKLDGILCYYKILGGTH